MMGEKKDIPVWGTVVDEGAIKQMETCLATGNAVRGALMGDHHLGYSAPVGGVIARHNEVSPSEVGFDIACGNKAVMTTASYPDVIEKIEKIMDSVATNISFGIGRVSNSRHIAGQADASDHSLFDSSLWDDIPMLSGLKEMARNQLGTVGSGNHYVDLFVDPQLNVWIGVHFGSRGLGHKIASHFIKEGGGKDGINVAPAVLSMDSDLGKEYWAAMNLAGDYAYAGRDWVCNEVARILGADIVDEVHNHHNFCWKETHGDGVHFVTRKGATPAFFDQRGFVGGSMGEDSVILKGVKHSDRYASLYSTVHGAGRVMSRTAAAGKVKWKKGVKTRVSEGCVSKEMMTDWISKKGVVLRGGGVDESPHCYKRLTEVLECHKNTVQVTSVLSPIGVAMAGSEIKDPYKD